MNENTCQNCAHYYQHYAFNKRKIIKVNCGHCVIPRLRNRRPYTAACEHFVAGPPDQDAFATKEYLSKELLQYLLNLPLLPEIEDISQKNPR